MRLEAQRSAKGLCCIFLFNDNQGSLNEKWRETSYRKILHDHTDDDFMKTKKLLSSIYDKFNKLLKV
jgi:hypothetical protein